MAAVGSNNSYSRRPPPDAALARLAKPQHGAVKVSQLRALGLSNSDISYRVAAGRLDRRHPRVYVVGHETRETRFLAAVYWAGDDALLSPIDQRVIDREGEESDAERS